MSQIINHVNYTPKLSQVIYIYICTLLQSLQETCLCTGFSELKKLKTTHRVSSFLPYKRQGYASDDRIQIFTNTCEVTMQIKSDRHGDDYITQNTITFITLRILVPVLSLTTVEMT